MTLIGMTIVGICLDEEAKAWSASQRIIVFACLRPECLEAKLMCLNNISLKLRQTFSLRFYG
jgi:hypothetical protein